jgi:hypothetical protein
MKLILADTERTALQQIEQELCVAGAVVSAVQVDVCGAWGVQTLALVALDTFGSVDLLFDYAGMSDDQERWESLYGNWAAALGNDLWSQGSASARLARAFLADCRQHGGDFLSIADQVLQSMA